MSQVVTTMPGHDVEVEVFSEQSDLAELVKDDPASVDRTERGGRDLA